MNIMYLKGSTNRKISWRKMVVGDAVVDDHMLLYWIRCINCIGNQLEVDSWYSVRSLLQRRCFTDVSITYLPQLNATYCSSLAVPQYGNRHRDDLPQRSCSGINAAFTFVYCKLSYSGRNATLRMNHHADTNLTSHRLRFPKRSLLAEKSRMEIILFSISSLQVLFT